MQYTDLIEALKPSEYRLFVKGWDKERYADIFKSDKYKHDKNGYRVYLPLGERKVDVSSVQKDIERYLGSNYEIVDYAKGIVKDKKKDQNVKIGKVLTKLSLTDLLNKYTSDPTREAVKDEYVVVISRHPYDIAGMSTNRGWTSCMNLQDGENRHYVPIEISNGTVVAYVTSKSDPDLKNPTGRVLIKPFVNVDDTSEVYFGIENKIYGTEVNGFIKAVRGWVDWVNKVDDLGKIIVVKLKDGSYNDSSSSIRTVGKLASDEDQQNFELAVKNPEHINRLVDPSNELQKALISHNPHLIKRLKNPSENAQLLALKMNAAIIELINNPTPKAQMLAVTINPYNIEYIKNPSEEVQLVAVNKRGLAIEYINDPSEEVQLAAVKQKPNALFNIKNPTEKVRQLYKDLTS